MQLPFASSLGAVSSLGEHSCFVAVICCSEVAQDGMGGRSSTGSQQLGATPRSVREDRRGKFEVRSQTRAAVKERERVRTEEKQVRTLHDMVVVCGVFSELLRSPFGSSRKRLRVSNGTRWRLLPYGRQRRDCILQ